MELIQFCPYCEEDTKWVDGVCSICGFSYLDWPEDDNDL